MYMSPLTVPMVPVSIAVLGVGGLTSAGLPVDRIGGTSTCWIPFLACIWAWMRDATAAIRCQLCLGSIDCETYPRQQQDPKMVSSQVPQLGSQSPSSRDSCSFWNPSLGQAGAIVSGDRSAKSVVLALSGRSVTSWPSSSRCRP